jgi:hypothetical protein
MNTQPQTVITDSVLGGSTSSGASLENAANSAERVSSVDVDLESFDIDKSGAEPADALKAAVGTALIKSDDRVSKKDLVQLLEGFVSILKTESGGELAISDPTSVTPQQLQINAQIDDRTAEIESLRNLVIEAQDTIIKLLTDRVEDRARIAGLETQVNILPDLQAQADRAMMVAVRTEEYRTEITKIKFELDRFRLFRVRSEVEKKKGTPWVRFQRWLFGGSRKTEVDAVKAMPEDILSEQ